ncbi:Ectonucleoside triphosphate diphosphohydrolase 8 [Thelohanellus kitauei]|uniref:Ectonucleoside triphosphate diphosphohydrolase 8 n=1 Tax=Thelohanellus kitauei TaxID=669202 RepID=A0A0C2MEQ2_THEKT|nr:Ectonucleoside triphosphate diphosphohydrolase 8 [Thelohanellus kitauei]
MAATKRDYHISLICMFVLAICFLAVALFGFFYRPSEIYEYGVVVDISSYDIEFNLYRWKNRKSIANTAHVKKKHTHSCDIDVHQKRLNVDFLREKMFSCVKEIISHVENFELYNSTIFIYGTELTRLMCESEFDKCNIIFGTIADVISSFEMRVVITNVKPLTGYDEALFGWISINRHLKNLQNGKTGLESYGGLDMKNYSLLISLETGGPYVSNSSKHNSAKHTVYGYAYHVAGVDMMCYGVRQGYERVTYNFLKEASVWTNAITHPCHTKNSFYDLDPTKLQSLCLTESVSSFKSYYRVTGAWDYDKCLALIHQAIDQTEKKFGLISDFKKDFDLSGRIFFGISRLAEVAAAIDFHKKPWSCVQILPMNHFTASVFDTLYMYVLISEKLGIDPLSVILGHKEKLETLTGSMIYHSREITPRKAGCIVGKFGLMHIFFSLFVFTGLGVFLTRKSRSVDKEIIV